MFTIACFACCKVGSRSRTTSSGSSSTIGFEEPNDERAILEPLLPLCSLYLTHCKLTVPSGLLPPDPLLSDGSFSLFKLLCCFYLLRLYSAYECSHWCPMALGSYSSLDLVRTFFAQDGNSSPSSPAALSDYASSYSCAASVSCRFDVSTFSRPASSSKRTMILRRIETLPSTPSNNPDTRPNYRT